MTARTSDRVSSIAARYINITGPKLMGMTAKPSLAEIAAADISAMAASCLRQDEAPGFRKRLLKVLRR